MADPKFFKKEGPFTLIELAEISGLSSGDIEVRGNIDPSVLKITGVASLDKAGPNEIGFLDNVKYVRSFSESNAGACIARRKHADKAPHGMALLISDNPYAIYARIATAFFPIFKELGTISKNSYIDKTAKIGKGCRVDSGAVIEADVEIGDNCHIAANVVIGHGVAIGSDSYIGANATITYAIIGERVIIHQGVHIGQDGFGFAFENDGYIKVPQVGRVIIGDDVEIGASTCIDRGSGPDTIIGSGTKIDNLVQIGHNVNMGKNCIIVSQVGISGSTKIGDYVTIGGQAGLTGHLYIGAGAKIAAQSGVMRDVPANSAVCGAPAIPIQQFHRQTVILQSLVKKEHSDGHKND